MKKPHVLGIDDAPFEKGQAHEVPIVGVMMEGATLVEGVALGAFPVDGPEATAYLAAWIEGQRWHRSLQAVVLGGITIAGLGMVDITALATAIQVPVLVATRSDTARSTLREALRAAGLNDRLAILARTPPAFPVRSGLYVASAGADAGEAAALIGATLGKAKLPEPLRIAHLIGSALVRGTSRGRV